MKLKYKNPQEKEYFNKIADIFDEHFNAYAKKAGKLRVKRRCELFFRSCGLKKGFKILEIGAGTGEYTRELLNYGIPIFCSDISFNMLKVAQKKVSGQRQVYCFVSDVEQLCLQENSFDVILGNSILHHLDPEKASQEVFRVLKRGGAFAFSEPNMVNPQVFLQKNIKFLKKITGDSPNETAFTKWQLKQIFEKTGFRSVRVEPFDFLHPGIPDSLAGATERLGLALEKVFLLREIAGSLFISGVK